MRRTLLTYIAEISLRFWEFQWEKCRQQKKDALQLNSTFISFSIHWRFVDKATENVLNFQFEEERLQWKFASSIQCYGNFFHDENLWQHFLVRLQVATEFLLPKCAFLCQLIYAESYLCPPRSLRLSLIKFHDMFQEIVFWCGRDNRMVGWKRGWVVLEENENELESWKFWGVASGKVWKNRWRSTRVETETRKWGTTSS
jgi:hypothetical protein